jgi:hypothetical protein
MERLDFRQTTNTALVAELSRHAGLDEAANPRRYVARAGDPEPWAGLAGSARIMLARLTQRPAAARVSGKRA